MNTSCIILSTRDVIYGIAKQKFADFTFINTNYLQFDTPPCGTSYYFPSSTCLMNHNHVFTCSLIHLSASWSIHEYNFGSIFIWNFLLIFKMIVYVLLLNWLKFEANSLSLFLPVIGNALSRNPGLGEVVARVNILALEG